MRILFVEDEEELAVVVAKAFRECGFAVDVAGDGDAGLLAATTTDYDAVVLDLMLPGTDGWAVLTALRATRTTPVLVLTARDGVADRVRGLNGGADDYVTKPFDLDELIARVRALVRRSVRHPSAVIRAGDLEVDTAARVVRRGGAEVPLAGKEFALLELLLLNRGKLITRTAIYDHLYEEQDETLSNVVDVYVSNLRRKLGPDLIETRRGQGYIVRV